MKRWDVFISHATEDKEAVVVPLADALRRAGLKVWLDRQELKIGDSLREKIDEGLAESRFGVVVLSQYFLHKQWPRRELNGLTALEENGQKVILPVWHEITKSELSSYSPTLADRLAANTSEGIDKVVGAILDVVLAPGSTSPSLLLPSRARCLNELLDRNADVSEIVEFLSAHPPIIQRSIAMTSLDDLVLSNVVFGPLYVPFVVVDGTLARPRVQVGTTVALPRVVLVEFANPSGRLIERGQLAAAIAARLGSIRGMIDRFKAEPLSPIQPGWDRRYPAGSRHTYSEVWRKAFAGAVVLTSDDLEPSRVLPNDRQVIILEAVLFAGRRRDQSEVDPNYLTQMAGNIAVHTYDRLLEQALAVDGGVADL